MGLVTIVEYQRDLEIKLDGFQDKDRFADIYKKQLESRGYTVNHCYVNPKDSDFLKIKACHADAEYLGQELTDKLTIIYIKASKSWSGTADA